MSEFVMAYDLTSLAEKLKERKQAKPLQQVIYRYLGAYSVMNDLRSARRALDALVGVASEPGSQIVGQALMTHVIVMYCRASVSQGGRSKVEIKRAFDDALLEKHRAIVGLRNTAIAHFDNVPANGLSAGWSQEKVVAIISPAGVRYNAPARRANYLAQVGSYINDLCVVSSQFVGKEIAARAATLTAGQKKDQACSAAPAS